MILCATIHTLFADCPISLFLCSNTYALHFAFKHILKNKQVIIITNSDEGWVKYSAERWLPNLIPILANYRIISARTRYEKFYPNQPLCWKAAAFAHEANEHFCALEDARALLERECSHRLLSTSTNTTSSAYSSPGVVSDGDSIQDIDMASTDVSSHMTGENDDSSLEEELDSPGAAGSEGEAWVGEVVSPLPSSYTATTTSEPSTLPPSMKREIVSFGDSIEERTAVRIVSDQLDATPKSVKFLTNPTPNQIIGQLVMLTHHMTYVGEYKSDLDLEISSRQAEKCALGYLHRRGLVTSALAATNNTMTTPQQSSMHASFF